MNGRFSRMKRQEVSMTEESGWASSWCRTLYPEGQPVVALRSEHKREAPTVRFQNMSREQLLEAGGHGVRRSEALPLLIAGFLKGITDERDEANLLALLNEEEITRLKPGDGPSPGRPSPPLESVVPESQRAGTTHRDLFIKRALKAAGLSVEQAVVLGKPGLTAE